MARKKSPRQTASTAAARRTYLRFTLSQRIQHWLMMISFLLLALTGLVQKYALDPVSFWILGALGGIEVARIIHHMAAVLLLTGVYHLLEIGYKLFVLRVRMTMLPSLQDARDAWAAFAYNLGLGKRPPQLGRYTFEEKAEYWALIWGTLIMAITGFLMWNPVASTRVLPGEFIPAAKAAHGGEAVLAVLAIIVWHMYGVHLKRQNKSMFTGTLTEAEMLDEHPLELADIKAGVDQAPADPAQVRRRQRVYFPIAAVLALTILAGIYGFVAGEETALTTVPPQENQPQVFVPQTPTLLPPPLPTSTAAPTPEELVLTWDGAVEGLFQQCTACHGAADPAAGLDLSGYAGAIDGSTAGPVIVPGDPADSRLVQLQQQGGHPGQFSPDQLQSITEWIDAGAPEN